MQRDDFGVFSVNAHRNAVTASHAVLRKAIDQHTYVHSRSLSAPVHVRALHVCTSCNHVSCVSYWTRRRCVTGQLRSS